MKNKKLIKMISGLALVVAFAGCSNDQEQTEDVENTSVEEPVENYEDTNEESIETIEIEEDNMIENDMSVESTDPQANSNEEINEKVSQEVNEQVNEETDLHVDDGIYVTTLQASNQGRPMEDIDFGTISDLKIEDNILTLYGTVNYREDETDYDNQVLLEGDVHNFQLGEDVEFTAVSGMAEPKVFSVDEFLQYENDVADSGLALIINLVGGEVKSVSISS